MGGGLRPPRLPWLGRRPSPRHCCPYARGQVGPLGMETPPQARAPRLAPGQRRPFVRPLRHARGEAGREGDTGHAGESALLRHALKTTAVRGGRSCCRMTCVARPVRQYWVVGRNGTVMESFPSRFRCAPELYTTCFSGSAMSRSLQGHDLGTPLGSCMPVNGCHPSPWYHTACGRGREV